MSKKRSASDANKEAQKSAESSKSDRSEKSSPSTAMAPDRGIGFLMMALTIAFVAFWMSQQNSRMASSELAGTRPGVTVPDGFRADAWSLADDELLGFVQIPAGPFIMGSNPTVDRMAYENERWSDRRRQGSVNLPTYYVSRFETTVAQFNEFLVSTGFQTQASIAGLATNLPVTNITWPEALAYARWLEEQMRQSSQTPAVLRQLLNDGGHVTLPSEAEWEKAARGTDGRVFPWGSDVSADRANFNAAAVGPVGAIACPECAHGLSDMAGNVWELTRSPFQDYPYDPDDDASNLVEDALWVMRGGAFSDAANNIRAAVRGGVDPGVRNNTIGFRLVISTL
jgi:formylglycine-generating enzyme required for sulfatase activity